jgi:hypothetical protein
MWNEVPDPGCGSRLLVAASWLLAADARIRDSRIRDSRIKDSRMSDSGSVISD